MQTVQIEKKREVLSLITDVTYASTASWYGATRKDLRMDVIAPKLREGHAPLPCLVWICGGAFLVRDKSVWIPEMMELARAGYVIASVEYRTSNDTPFPAPLVDIKAAVRYLRAHAREFCIDTDKIVVMGESAGGTLASLTGLTANMPEYEQGDYLQYSSTVQGVVNFYGLTDLTISDERYSYSENVPDWTVKSFLGAGTYQENLLKASAVHQVTEQAPSFLILHGTEDHVCPVENSMHLHEALERAGVYHEFYLVEGAEHGDDRFYQTEMMDIIKEFLQRILN